MTLSRLRLQSTELADRFVGQAVAEILLRRIAGQVFERQNREFDRCLFRALQPTVRMPPTSSPTTIAAIASSARRDRDPRVAHKMIAPRYPRRRAARDASSAAATSVGFLIPARRILFQTAFDHDFQRRRH